MLGSNVPTIGGLVKAFVHADEWGCECIQVYLTPSRTWSVPELSESTISAFKEAWANSGVKEVVAHVPFLVNIASSDLTKRKLAIIRLEVEVKTARQLGVRYLVLHPGSAGGKIPKQDGIKYVLEGLNFALTDSDSRTPRILLETMAGQGSMIGSRFEEIADIIAMADMPEKLGVCFDIAHVYFAGYDIRRYAGYDSVIEEFDEVVGIKHIYAFHLNDAKTRLGSGCDRHANIGEGKLGLQVFHALVRDKRFANVPKILEIPDRDKRSKENLALLKDLRLQSKPLAETVESEMETFQLYLTGM